MSRERVSRNATFAFAAQMIGAVLTAGLTIFLARALTPEQYGFFTFGMSVLTIASLFADLGITSSTGRFLAERRDDPEGAAAVFRTALRLKLRVSLIASAALFGLAGPICDLFGAGGAEWVLRGLSLALFGQSVFLLLLGSFIALGVIRYNVVLATAESVVEVASAIVLVLLGAAATGAAFGRAIGYAAGLAVGLLVASNVIGRIRTRSAHRSHRHPPVSERRILSYAGPLLLVDAAFRVFASIDVLLISAIVGAGSPVAAYGLAMQLAVFLDYPAAALSSAVAPRLAGAGRSDVRLFEQSTRYLIALQMLFTAPLVIWPEAIVELLFGHGYPEAPDVLLALVPYVFLSGIAQITTLSVNYLGEARRRVPIAFAMLSVNVALNLVLLPRIGIVGAAIGTSVAYAIWVPAHVWIMHRRVDLPLRPLLTTTVRACVAGAAMVGALALLGTGDVSLQVMALGAVVGPAVYVAALFLLRELTRADIAVVRAAIARRAGG
ncbi:flippase [Conexibacter arvalis]|uniref:O-antigen/teichoic acid export membrane protein n=1 Tax=Conexibacter arvalis TaxID=912552 RepID=A0A840I9U3_9ACTN|nr:flippase [Conexibacter arvalis]MBB4661679.1 O-antigen/teichoic acid export membrane protein [Conexibacter arvalis]